MLTVRETAELLKSDEYDNILILTHVRPDGDTVGCAAALCAALRRLGKSAYIYPNPGLTEHIRPYCEPYIMPDEAADFNVENYGKMISVDIATENLFPRNAEKYKGKVDLAMDHHPSFEGFGKNNIVRPEAAACGELLYDILSALGPITPEIALPLYIAISTDCGCFAYNNTTSYTHSVAAALIRTGIDYQAVNKIFFRTKSRVRMQLEAAILQDAVFCDSDRIVILSVPLSLTRSMSASESDLEELSSLGGQIEGVDCAVTMRELEPDVWKFSLRTGRRINATEACKLLGGGGHAAAAGCTIRGASYEEARAKMLRAIVRVSDAQI